MRGNPASFPYLHEASNVMFSLTSLGHVVVPISDADSGAFSAGLAGADVLLLPENCQFCDSFVGDLSIFAKSVITDYVSNGGGLIINGTFGSRATDFLNDSFGWTLTGGVVGPITETGYGLDASDSAGTAFQGGPAVIAANDAPTGILTTTLPTEARIIYTSLGDPGYTGVSLFPFGDGQVVYLGWDWFWSAPRFSDGQDGGWNEVLDNAVRTAAIPEPSTASLLAFGLVGVAAGRRRGARSASVLVRRRHSHQRCR